ncbi:lipoyl(octanoyl) transferase LipB [Haliangium sp.]|uniref:lipoyl(octanoyl) transferase LipB n=1 Tax=Haliangium sp. TaxID=2663208 RepID=UPI003D130F15
MSRSAISTGASAAGRSEPVDDARTAAARPEPGGVPARVVDLGDLGYREAHARQLAVLDQRKQGAGVDTLFMVEHPHVITLGRSQKALANVLAPGEVDVVAVERGGDVTYHGPGQLVAYPVVRLDDGERDLHRFLRLLETGIIDTLAEHGLRAGRSPGNTGVWIEGRKIASIGIACRRWVTFHGLALNVNTDLSYFRRINPCGFQAGIMTSMAAELGHAVDFAVVKQDLVAHLGRALGRAFAA